MLIENPSLTNHTASIFPQMQQPQSSLRRMGLMGVGQDAAVNANDDWERIQTGINSQLLFLINLDRLQSGQQALSPDVAAPKVQAQLDSKTKQMLTLAALGIGGILLFSVIKR